MSKLWTPPWANRPKPVDTAVQQQHVVDINRALRRARRLVERAYRKPVGSNGRDRDMADARDLVNGVLGIAGQQGWGTHVRQVKGVPELMRVLNID